MRSNASVAVPPRFRRFSLALLVGCMALGGVSGAAEESSVSDRIGAAFDALGSKQGSADLSETAVAKAPEPAPRPAEPAIVEITGVVLPGSVSKPVASEPREKRARGRPEKAKIARERRTPARQRTAEDEATGSVKEHVSLRADVPSVLGYAEEPSWRSFLGMSWGVQVAGGLSQQRALANFGTLQRRHKSLLAGLRPTILRNKMGGKNDDYWYEVRVGSGSRDSAEKLCAGLSAAGATCAVVRN